MKIPKTSTRFILTFALFAAVAAGTARAQNYTVTGTTSGGGEAISGSGAPGPLSGTTTPVALSAGGFDIVTILPGADVFAPGVDPLLFTTSNDTLLNSGTITALSGYNPVSFIAGSGTSLANEIIINNGTIVASTLNSVLLNSGTYGTLYGNNETGANAGVGIALTSGSNISGITISNSASINGASITGGTGGNQVASTYGYGDVGANYGDGIALTAPGSITDINITNSGLIVAGGIENVGGYSSDIGSLYGSGSNAGASASVGISLISAQSVSSVTIVNSGTIAGAGIVNDTAGHIASVYSGTVGGNAADGIAITAANSATGISINNSGLILGNNVSGLSNNVNVADDYAYSPNGVAGANAADGIAITAGNLISNITITNTGTITAGPVSGITQAEVGSSYDSDDVGSTASDGITLASGTGGITTVTITNSGLIQAGDVTGVDGYGANVAGLYSNNSAGGDAGDGITLTSLGAITTVTIKNSGTIAAGTIATGSGAQVSFLSSDNNAGGNAGVGIAITSGSGISGVTITNSGLISGGNIGPVGSNNNLAELNSYNSTGANADLGIGITSFTNIDSISITNTGTISAAAIGNVGDSNGQGQLASTHETGVGANAGDGIAITANGTLTNITITNKGAILAGSLGTGTNNSNAGANYGYMSVGGNADDGIALTSGTSISGITITNSGAITAGSVASGGSVTSFEVGSSYEQSAGSTADIGIAITTGTGGISSVLIQNTGSITTGQVGGVNANGGYGANLGDLYGYSASGGVADDAIALTTTGSVSNVQLQNSGLISAGSLGDIAAGGEAGNSYEQGAGGAAGVGFVITTEGGIDTVSIVNTGTIAGGGVGLVSGSNYNASDVGNNYSYNTPGGNAADGIALVTTGTISNIGVQNKGVISAGSIGDVTNGGEAGNIYEQGVGGNAGVGIAFTSNNISSLSFLNDGTISGGSVGNLSGTQTTADVGNNYSYNGVGGNAADGIALVSANQLTSVTVTNHGAISGGSVASVGLYGQLGNNFEQGVGGNADVGFAAVADSGITTLSIGNTGSITAGSIGNIGSITGTYQASDAGVNNSNGAVGGNAGDGIVVVSGYVINGLTLVSTGTIAGAQFGSIELAGQAGSNFQPAEGGNAGNGVSVDAALNLDNVLLVNKGTITAGSFGTVTGEYGPNYYTGALGDNFGGGASGGNAADGIAMANDGFTNSITVLNTGTITAGNVGAVTDNSRAGDVFGYGSDGGNIATGFVLTGPGSITTVNFVSPGSIIAGSVGGVSNQTDVGSIFEPGVGGNAAVGLALNTSGSLSNVSLSVNSVTAGSLGNVSEQAIVGAIFNSPDAVGGNAGVGIALDSGGSISHLSLVITGPVTGGAVGDVSGTSTVGGVYNSSGAVGGNVSDAVAIVSAGPISNLSIVNYGRVTGGSIGTVSSDSILGSNIGAGIYIASGGPMTTSSLTNFGTITGGAAGAGAPAGYGIVATGGGLTITNYGAISAGSGSSTATVSGYPAVAINVQGSNNTINLDGHSSVNGTLQGANSGTNNVLNLNFTGVSPAEIANLKAQLTAQGWPGTNDFTGTFTLRGVTYHVDPLILNLNLSSYQLQAVTPNESAIGASLDSATVNPPPGSLLFALYNAIDNSGNVPGSLEALSPEKFAILGDLAIAHSDFLVHSIDARLNNIREGSESVDTSGVGGATVAGLTKDDGKTSKEIQPAATPTPDRWGFFATGDGLFFRGNAHDIDMQESGKANTAGTLIGVDGKAGDHAILGAMFAYDNTSAELDGSTGHANVESYTGGIYADWHDSGFYLNGLGAYTRNTYHLDRDITLGGLAADATSSPNGNEYTVNLDGGYDWNATERIAVGPMIGAQYVHLDINSFNESNAGPAGLAVNSENLDSLQSRVGVHANYHLATTATSSFALDFHAAWQHEYLDDSRAIGANFEGAGLAPFAVQTASPKRDAAVIGLGVNATFHDRLTLFTDYELEIWSASYFEQTINGGVRVSF